MKGLDTPVLLRILRGEERVRALLRGLHGEEVATTEWNMFELEALLRIDRSPGRERRAAALEKLRRRLTVVPIDESAHRAARQLRGVPTRPSEFATFVMIAALAARGCDTWVTTTGHASPRIRGPVKVETVR